MQDALARGTGTQVGFAHHALSVLEVGLGRYEAAVDAAEEAVANGAQYVGTWTLPELVEAAVRTERYDVAEDAVSRLEESTQAAGTDWGLGMLARSRALVSRNGRRAALPGGNRAPRAHAGDAAARPRAAPVRGVATPRAPTSRPREQLRSVQRMFSSIGAREFPQIAQPSWCDRQRLQCARPLSLDPSPVRASNRSAGRGGGTNAEIAAQLYVSRRTVEYHLHKSSASSAHLSAQLASALEHPGSDF